MNLNYQTLEIIRRPNKQPIFTIDTEARQNLK